MKEKMQAWCKAQWVNLSEKSAKSVVNRVIAVIEKEPTSLKAALTGLIQSLNALASKEDTSEQDQAELWFITEFMGNILMPIVEPIDAITKAKSAEKATTHTPKKRIEVWADTQEEAIALREALEDEKPAKPTRKPRAEAVAVTASQQSLIDAISALLNGVK